MRFQRNPRNPYRDRKFARYDYVILVIVGVLFATFILVVGTHGYQSTNRKLKGLAGYDNGGQVLDGKSEPHIEPRVTEILNTLQLPSNDVDDGIRLKIMTFNLRYASASDGPNSWMYRKDHLIDIINRYHPVVMGTQEGLHDQLNEIHQRLISGYKKFGVEREPNGEYEAIFYDTQIVERLDGGNFWLSDTPEIGGTPAWGAGCVRLTTWCKFRLKATNQHFYFFNTQFDHVSKKARINSAALIWKKIQEITLPHDPVFVVGDFNTYRYTDTYKYLSTDIGANFAEAWKTAKKKIGTISYTYHGWAGKNKAEEATSTVAAMHID